MASRTHQCGRRRPRKRGGPGLLPLNPPYIRNMSVQVLISAPYHPYTLKSEGLTDLLSVFQLKPTEDRVLSFDSARCLEIFSC